MVIEVPRMRININWMKGIDGVVGMEKLQTRVLKNGGFYARKHH